MQNHYLYSNSLGINIKKNATHAPIRTHTYTCSYTYTIHKECAASTEIIGRNTFSVNLAQKFEEDQKSKIACVVYWHHSLFLRQTGPIWLGALLFRLTLRFCGALLGGHFSLCLPMFCVWLRDL